MNESKVAKAIQNLMNATGIFISKLKADGIKPKNMSFDVELNNTDTYEIKITIEKKIKMNAVS